MNETRLNQEKKYAEMLVRAGGNVQKGQPVIISSDISNAVFARMVQEYAYDAGASEVSIIWTDEASTRTRYFRAADETFDVFPQWMADRYKYYDDNNAVYLHVSGSDPDLLAGVDADRIRRYMKVQRTALKPHSALTMSNARRWSVVAMPNPKWAVKMFPGVPVNEAVEKLWDCLLKASRANGENPIEDWAAHRKNFEGRKSFLNEKQFETLHITNSLGTDLTLGMPKNHVWQGGGDIGQDGVPFFPNMPTEEIFSAPHRAHANGKVVASMPLNYQGSLIEGFGMTFKDGRVESYYAKENEAVLGSIIEMDEGARYLGEIALVSNSSPIAQMNTLFYSTLFDENASCHLALGKAYPDCVKNGIHLSEKELEEAGLNDSLTHVDFMFGTPDMRIVGISADGKETIIMENGEYTF